ncbi:hypothetical protein CY34DRAFT_800720 [Suillus luteus UH-Slu-Lm8-n1]|uniref:Uncharacterized protein n=1 Tax=Suillus luteus UH-Slu-Lm8-n1 TaxID=930992 RepID=A0A0D0B8Q8_9AGAM|nr:hypothetical protein CY34DRAFT_800720 [Suillus luteus UH-Slu-Lm8-n1]
MPKFGSSSTKQGTPSREILRVARPRIRSNLHPSSASHSNYSLRYLAYPVAII